MFKSYGLFCPLFRGVITDRVTRARFYFLTISLFWIMGAGCGVLPRLAQIVPAEDLSI